MSPQLPSLVTLRPEFDAMTLEDQAALIAGMVDANERRRRTAEAILARCGTFIKGLE